MKTYETYNERIKNRNFRKNGRVCIVCGKELTGWQQKYCSDLCRRS